MRIPEFESTQIGQSGFKFNEQNALNLLSRWSAFGEREYREYKEIKNSSRHNHTTFLLSNDFSNDGKHKAAQPNWGSS